MLRKATAALSKRIDAEPEDDDDDFDLDIQVAYRETRLAPKKKQAQDLSDDVKLRLLIARTKALDKFREVWGERA